MLKQLILIRHPELEWGNIKNPEDKNNKTRLIGHTDINLSRKGALHSEKIATFIKNKIGRVDKLYSSPLIRTFNTAEIISKKTGRKIIKNEALKEINFGMCEGVIFNDLKKKFPKTYDDYLNNKNNIHFPGGESLLNFNKRVHIFIKKIIKEGNGTIIIVTHGGVIRSILCKILGLNNSFTWKIKQDYGAINILRTMDGKSFFIDKINHTI